MPIYRTHRKQQGAALLTALAFLIIITLLSINAIRTSTLELTMASNEQASTEAVQSAQSAIDALIAPINFPVTPHYVGCYNYTSGASDASECTAFDTLPDTVTTLPHPPVTAATNKVRIRLESDGSFICRACESSASLFDGAVFTIESRYDNTSNRGGRAEIDEGFLMLIPKN